MSMKVGVRVAVVCLVAVVVAGDFHLPDEDYQTLFAAYIKKHHKHYVTPQVPARYHIFKSTYDKILHHNNLPAAERQGVEMGLTAISDLTAQEYRARLGFRPRAHARRHVRRVPLAEGPLGTGESLDWTQLGAVNPVKDQGQCGSCWAFSAVAAAEAAVFQGTGTLPRLSEQQVVDCSTGAPYFCDGCGGCLMHFAFQYMVDKQRLCSEDQYPYLAQDEDCQVDTVRSCSSYPFTGYENITCADDNFCDRSKVLPGNETSLLEAVKRGVVSVAIEADQALFQNYHKGVITRTMGCGKDLDHGVAIVGFGTDNGTDYWLVRNSWGDKWGLNGYVQIERGANVCGIAEYSSIPTFGA